MLQYTGKIVTFLGVYFTRLCFKLNNLTGQKFAMSELKLSWRASSRYFAPCFDFVNNKA
jgi:hypothetical protein